MILEIIAISLIFSLLFNLLFDLIRDSNDRIPIKVKRLTAKNEPFYTATDGSVCADCYARTSAEIECGERTTIPLGFALELPMFCEAVIRPRSGMSKKGIDVQIGTIDSDYRGEVCCTVVNNTKEKVIVEEGMRICQIAFREVPALDIQLVDNLKITKRGNKGFGSSGEK